MAIILKDFDEFVKKYNFVGHEDPQKNMHVLNKLVVNKTEDKYVLTYTAIQMLLDSNMELKKTVAEQQKQIKALSDHCSMLEQRLDQFWDMTHLRIDSLFEKDNI